MPLRRPLPLSGFALVEALLALAVLALAAWAAYGQLLGAHRQARLELDRVQARLLAQQELEQLRACPHALLREWQPPQIPAAFSGHLRFHYLDRVEPRPDGAIELTVQVMPGGGRFDAEQAITVRGLAVP